MSKTFFQDINPEASFKALIKENKYHPLPNDWYIIATDIVNSTQAIESGKYKNVNTIGVSCIIAAVNCNKNIAIPYVFGGDGAFIAAPSCMIDDIKEALATLINMSAWQYKLTLRVGVFSAEEIYKLGLELAVGKFKLSKNIVQTCINGSGWDHAERIIKSNQNLSNLIGEKDCNNSKIDLTGFECRWKNIKARYNHKICILIAALNDNNAINEKVYMKVYEKILDVYGSVNDHHPVSINQLHFRKNPYQYLNEVKTKFATQKQYFKHGFQALCKILLMTLIGSYLMKKNKETKHINWGNYKHDFVLNSDYQKFDGGLKMIIDGSDEKHQKIINYLNTEQNSGKIAYGVHLCESALVTCYITSYQKNHIHFIDGSDGGYAMAAKMLKERLNNKLKTK